MAHEQYMLRHTSHNSFKAVLTVLAVSEQAFQNKEINFFAVVTMVTIFSQIPAKMHLAVFVVILYSVNLSSQSSCVIPDEIPEDLRGIPLHIFKKALAEQKAQIAKDGGCTKTENAGICSFKVKKEMALRGLCTALNDKPACEAVIPGPGRVEERTFTTLHDECPKPGTRTIVRPDDPTRRLTPEEYFRRRFYFKRRPYQGQRCSFTKSVVVTINGKCMKSRPWQNMHAPMTIPVTTGSPSDASQEEAAGYVCRSTDGNDEKLNHFECSYLADDDY
ncbi:uncharacterized protein LOC143468691 [Clavelina lepadiformis]|uniref:uncharacterized protein LOC143468691 n=1 Tax=Clavelina lepadiformis TaxID=159417 RepID=UPI00404373BB